MAEVLGQMRTFEIAGYNLRGFWFGLVFSSLPLVRMYNVQPLNRCLGLKVDILLGLGLFV